MWRFKFIETIIRKLHGYCILSISIIILHSSGCDHGLAPPSVTSEIPGFTGTIQVKSDWPPKDSLFDLRVVAFRKYPPKNILEEIINGTVMFSDPLEEYQDEQTYRVQREDLSGVFEYVVVAQQYGSDVFQNWRVVGVYTKTGNVELPTPINLGKGSFVNGIDITVDFYHLPPQPF